MISNYIKLAFRNLKNNRLYAFLNIVGLAIGLAGGIIVMFWVADEWGYNQFHRNLANIHLILQHQTQGGVTYTFESTPGPLAAALRTEVPEIARAARCSWTERHLLNYDEKGIYERGFYAEPDFFSIMDFPALKGDPVTALKEGNSVVLTERAAQKFFGNADPIGKTIRHNNLVNLKVGAVIKNVPANSSIRFDVVLPFQLYERENADWINSSWGNNSMPTYVELQPNTDIEPLNAKLKDFVQAKNPDAAAHVFVYPLDRWRLWNRFNEGQQSGGRIILVTLLAIIGAFILLIGCINFMNLATARSEKRAKEVGVRKTMGAQRGAIVRQFLSESMVMAFLALVLALCVTGAMLPAFNRFFDKELSFATAPPFIWIGVLALGLITGLIAGSYPALFLSRFQPVKVMKSGASSEKGNGVFRKTLVTFQFVISIFLIIATIVLFKQINYVQARPLGYELDNLLEIPVNGDMSGKYDAVKNELLQVPGVNNVSAGSDNMVQFGSNTSGIEWPGKTDDQDFLVAMTWVRHDWVKTMGLKLAQGRDFSLEHPSDSMACIINQTAVKRMGLKEPIIGTQLRQDTTKTIIGVVEDFVFNNPTKQPEPLFVQLGPNNYMGSFFVRLSNNELWRKNLGSIESVVKKHNPSFPFEARFTEDEYQKSFEEVQSISQLAVTFGGIAIFISCLGLFGLSAFTAERRRKEIGIRKVLGASVQGIWLQLSSDFFKPVFVAFIIASPLAYFAMEKALSMLEYRINIPIWVFLAAGGIALVVAFITVSFQGIKAALSNPVKSLKSE
jgi:putative ABC transport system permease protein